MQAENERKLLGSIRNEIKPLSQKISPIGEIRPKPSRNTAMHSEAEILTLKGNRADIGELCTEH